MQRSTINTHVYRYARLPFSRFCLFFFCGGRVLCLSDCCTDKLALEKLAKGPMGRPNVHHFPQRTQRVRGIRTKSQSPSSESA